MVSLQPAQGENGHQADFLFLRELQAFQDRHWKPQDRQICENVEGRPAEPESKQVRAVPPGDTLVPVVIDGPAGEDGGYDHHQASNTDHDDERPRRETVTSVDQKPKILIQDRVLDKKETQVVDDDAGI